MSLESLYFPSGVSDQSKGWLPDAAVESEAALSLGRFDGALRYACPATLRVFAARVVRRTLVGALRREGHAFTDERFHAWFAGLATLSDETAPLARPPRGLCEAILTEFTHSSWEPLATLSARFGGALLAPADPSGTAHAEAHALLAEGRRLTAQLASKGGPLPFDALKILYQAIAKDLTFAPTERAPGSLTLGSAQLAVERGLAPSPLWAPEIMIGESWRSAGWLSIALPFPGLIRVEAFRPCAETGSSRSIAVRALADLVRSLAADLAEADQARRRIEAMQPGKRITSRAPALLELLAGFGGLRSAQLEPVLGATRLGVRTILSTLSEVQAVERRVVAGVQLHAAALEPRVAPSVAESHDEFAFSSTALDEYDASMAHIDDLLSRSSTLTRPAEIE